MVNINIPFILDLSTGAFIDCFEIVLPSTQVDYVFDMYCYHFTATTFRNVSKYIFDNSNDLLFYINGQSETEMITQLTADVEQCPLLFCISGAYGSKNCFDGSKVPPMDDLFGKMVVKQIASCLFGHPEAQALIRNSKTISSTVVNKQHFSEQLVNRMRGINISDGPACENDALGAIYKQLFLGVPNRFELDDTNPLELPIEQSDVIILDINMNISVAPQEYSYNKGYTPPIVNVNNLFNKNIGYDKDNSKLLPRRYRVKMHLCRDYLSSTSDKGLAVGMGIVSKEPTGDIVKNAWVYEKKSIDTIPHINWTFYFDQILAINDFRKLECFYIKMFIPTGKRIPWIRTFSQPMINENDAHTSYRSLWDMRGYYDDGYGSPITKNKDIIMHFGAKTPTNTFFHIEASVPTYNVLTYRQAFVNSNEGPRQDTEKIILITLTTDSTAPPDSYLFYVKEVGYKFSGCAPVITTLIP